MTFETGMARAGVLLAALALSQPVHAETKKTTSSAPTPAPVVRAAPAPAPVVRAAPAPVVRTAPVVRAAPAQAPAVRAPATTTAARPATPATTIKPATTVAAKPAATASVKTAATANAKPASTASSKPAATTASTKPATTAAIKPAATTAAKPATTAAGSPTAMDKARNRIQSELPADGAVRGDTGPKPSVLGVKSSEFKGTGPKLKPLGEPPSPGHPNFPKRPANDPAPTNPLSR